MHHADNATADRLFRWEKIALALFGLMFVAFGSVVIVRSALQENRKTDFGVYARAAHAVRTGQDVYAKSTCDDHGWHYCYPVTFAVVLAPLADPNGWDDRTGYLPFAVSVGVWYVLSVGFLAIAVHTFVKPASPELQFGSRKWWYARTIPVLICLGGVGFTLSRGQVNLLVVLFLAMMFAASVKGRSISAGVWLAAAVALKVIPLVFLLFPVVVCFRSNGHRVGRFFETPLTGWRLSLGFLVGLIVFLGVVPTLVLGFDGMVRSHETLVDTVLAPGAFGTGDQTRARELTDATATHSQSFQGILHNLRHPDLETRPHTVDATTRLIALMLGGMVTVITAAVGLRRLSTTPADRLIFLGCVATVMVLISPVSHQHYSVYLLPLVAGLWLKRGEDRILKIVLIAWAICTAVPLLPDPVSVAARDFGLGTVATIGLWVVGLRSIAQRTEPADSKRPGIISRVGSRRRVQSLVRCKRPDNSATPS